MKINKLVFRIAALSISIVAIAAAAAAQTSPSKTFPNIKIDNFGQINAHYYRGAQPGPDDYAPLAALGVKTVVDLRDDPTDYEKHDVEAAGMRYVNIPMSGWREPRDQDISAFLKLASDPSSGTIFVHCKKGIHRTGVTAAIYRFTADGWDYDKAYQEMKNYNFYIGMVHGSLKSYVKKYAERLKAEKKSAAKASGEAAK